MLAAVEYPALVEYRAFRNTDPPQLAEIWRSQAAQRGLMQPMSMAVFERFVLSKPVFERRGLIVAVEDGKALGFVHAGFGPSADGGTLSTARGVTCLLMLRPEADPSLAGPLLAASESYLRDTGAVELYGGGCYPLSPFYYGLYGGSELSGVLDSDTRLQAIFADHGYRAAKRSLVLHRDLAGFRPVIDRQQMQIRRQTSVEMLVDAPTTNWWEACIFEPFDRTRCVLNARDGGTPASVNFWNMETMAGAWGLHAVGVAGLEITQTRRRQGLGTYLLGEAFRHLHAQGVALVEVHVAEDNAAARALFANLGFTQVDASTLYRKE
jgi:GNAT superfamily N-acetyltransferase